LCHRTLTDASAGPERVSKRLPGNRGIDCHISSVGIADFQRLSSSRYQFDGSQCQNARVFTAAATEADIIPLSNWHKVTVEEPPSIAPASVM
jgi:hypothetical protein